MGVIIQPMNILAHSSKKMQATQRLGAHCSKCPSPLNIGLNMCYNGTYFDSWHGTSAGSIHCRLYSVLFICPSFVLHAAITVNCTR